MSKKLFLIRKLYIQFIGRLFEVRGLALLKTVEFHRAPDFTKRDHRCMSCGNAIKGGGDNIYSKRFCSEICKLHYLI